MNTRNLQNKVKKIGLVFALLLGFVLFGGIGADAQNRNRWQNSYDRDGSDWHRSAVQFGHRDGMRQGRWDAGRNRAFNWQGARHYRRARRGYDARWGSFTAFRRAYRGGFTIGYNKGFGNRRDRRGY